MNEDEPRQVKYIISISVDKDDIAAMEMAKKLYNISTRSEMIRIAMRMIIDLKIKEMNNNES
jgi:metal-responsive CopG/Arc/MetJ family transcriptional regulator